MSPAATTQHNKLNPASTAIVFSPRCNASLHDSITGASSGCSEPMNLWTSSHIMPSWLILSGSFSRTGLPSNCLRTCAALYSLVSFQILAERRMDMQKTKTCSFAVMM